MGIEPGPGAETPGGGLAPVGGVAGTAGVVPETDKDRLLLVSKISPCILYPLSSHLQCKLCSFPTLLSLSLWSLLENEGDILPKGPLVVENVAAFAVLVVLLPPAFAVVQAKKAP